MFNLSSRNTTTLLARPNSVSVTSALLQRNQSANNRAIRRLASLPRSSNKSMWRFLERTPTLQFNTEFYTAPNAMQALLLVHSLCAPITAQPCGHVTMCTPYTRVSPRDSTYHLCTMVQVPRNATLGVRFTQFPLLHSQSIAQVPKPALAGIAFQNNSYLFAQPNNLDNLTRATFFYKQWVYEISRVLYFFLFIKIKYKGKSYKWFKKNTAIILRFGYSHVAFTQIPDFFFSKKIGKMKLIFFGTSYFDLRGFLSDIIVWRPMNIYNGRGLRFAKQLVFRKFGKVSAYR